MARDSYVNVSRSKSSKKSVQGEITQIDIDLLWPYNIHRFALDTDNPGGTSIQITADTSAPELEIQVSVDALSWTTLATTWIIAPGKSQFGSGPSFVSILQNPSLVRFVRFRVPSVVRNPSVRVLGRLSEMQASENSKYTLEDMRLTTRDKLPIGIVGDSNAVMRYGMKRSLNSGDSRLAMDASLGASSILLVAKTLDGVEADSAEVLLINSNVVEYLLLQEPDYNHELGTDAVRHILAHCHVNQMFPIRVIWPQMAYLRIKGEHPNPELAPDRYFSNQSELLGIPYIDGYRLLDKISQAWKRSNLSLFKFRDDAHLSHMPSQVIGRGIRRLLEEMKASGELKQLSTALSTVPVFTMAGLARTAEAVAGLSETARHKVRTSLISQDFLEILQNQSICVPIPDGFEIVGYLIDARRCNATLRISGETSLNQRANFAGFSRETDAHPFVCVRPLPKPIRPANGHVMISCEPFRSTDHGDNIAKKIGSDYQLENGQLHLGDLILRSTNNSQKIIRADIEDLDLTNRVRLF